MVGLRADDHWDATSGGSPEAVLQTIDDAAAWIRQRLKAGSGSTKSLPMICLDTDGAICTWTRPEDTNPEMIASAIDQLDADSDEDALDGSMQSSMGERFPNLPLEVNYTSLSDDQTSEGSRRVVIATPDISVRLLIDHLDSMGIRIGRVESIWTLIAHAWDPGAPHRSTSRNSQRVVSTDDPVCGTVILDPSRSRLIWTWSKQGKLIASGSMRVQAGSTGPALQIDDLSRLCADWLGWASQLGVVPMRVVLVVPEVEEGLDRAQIGNMFSKHWASATVDLVTEADPILATLRAIQGIEDDSFADSIAQSSHSSPTFGGQLTHRAGRTHRSMYRWAGAALMFAGMGIGWTAWTYWNQGSQTASEAKVIRSKMVQKAMALQPPIIEMRGLTFELQARLNLLLAKSGPVKVTPTKPVMEELETISFVLGMSGIEIDSIQLTHTLVKVQIRVNDLQLAEQINEAFRSIDGSHLQWRATPGLKNRGEQIEASYTATWNSGSSS